VVEHIHEFLIAVFYSLEPQRYVFPIDPEVGLLEGPGGATNHQVVAALARQFPDHFGGSKSTADFLRLADKFWVKRGGMHWYSMRVAHNPLFVVDRTESHGELLHVHRVH
jgi:hypothetical protein